MAARRRIRRRVPRRGASLEPVLDRVRARRFGAFVDVAYGSASLPAGYRIVTQLACGDAAAGFIAEGGDAERVAVLASTGTSLRWYDDLDVTFVPYGGGRIGAGYLERYRALRGIEALTAPYVLVGHGLGGALATVHVAAATASGAPLPAEIYTFGSPRVGNAEFVAAYDALRTTTWRIANHRDLTQRIPAADYGYEHVATLVRLDSMDRAPLDHDGTHAMRTYLRLLDPGTSST